MSPRPISTGATERKGGPCRGTDLAGLLPALFDRIVGTWQKLKSVFEDEVLARGFVTYFVDELSGIVGILR
jgi:hypothetical protein